MSETTMREGPYKYKGHCRVLLLTAASRDCRLMTIPGTFATGRFGWRQWSCAINTLDRWAIFHTGGKVGYRGPSLAIFHPLVELVRHDWCRFVARINSRAQSAPSSDILREANVLRPAKLEHPVQRGDSDCHLGRLPAPGP